MLVARIDDNDDGRDFEEQMHMRLPKLTEATSE
jgi:hypothetical protein